MLTRPNWGGGEADHVWPEILPGRPGRCCSRSPPRLDRLDQAQVAVLDLRTGRQTVLIRGGSDARYVSSGHLLYAAAGSMRAVAFDLAGSPSAAASVTVLPGVQTKATGAGKRDGGTQMGRWSTFRGGVATGPEREAGMR